MYKLSDFLVENPLPLWINIHPSVGNAHYFHFVQVISVLVLDNNKFYSGWYSYYHQGNHLLILNVKKVNLMESNCKQASVATAIPYKIFLLLTDG